MAVAAALIARATARRAYAVWPSTLHPRIATDLAHPTSAAWLRSTFEPDAPRRIVSAATWSALRAHGLLVGPPSTLVAEGVCRALDRDVAGLHLALYSPTGQSLSKAVCFVFDDASGEPMLVVKAMPEARYADRLRHETEIVEAIRLKVGPSSRTAAPLPLAPLFAGTIADEYVVVQPIDPLAASTGRLLELSAALAWLSDFQVATTTTIRAWDAADTEKALDEVRYAWSRARPASAGHLVARAERLLKKLEGHPVRRCAVHGDFWRGNIAQRGGSLRVYDWEWAQPEGTPFFDLWASELGPLRRQAELGEPRLAQPIRDAVSRVAAELERQAIDPSFAHATLAPSLARLVFRVRRATGIAGGAEAESARLMASVETLL